MTLALLLVLAQPFPNVMSVRNPTAADGGVRILSVNSPASDPSHVILEGFDAGFTMTGTVFVRNMPPPPKRNPLTGATYVDGSGAVQPVSASTLPLPTGAATDAQVAQLAQLLAAIVANQTNGSETVRVANQPPAPKRNLAGAAIVDGSGVVQPVAASALPLPTNAAMEDGGALSAILGQLSSLIAVEAQGWNRPPINPFLPRCNAVRKTGCQP